MSKSASQLNEKTTPSLREQEEPSPTQSANSSIQELAASHGIEAAFEAKVALINIALAEIGFGRFQISLFFVAGLGWFADNLWLQGVALVLPGVQNSFNPTHIATSTLFLYVGLILGASFFGMSADLVGRKLAWNATLLISGVFGMVAAASTNFNMWCAMLCLIGFGAGGNLPVDGAMFLEFLPQKKQWLLTLLSAWWAVGQVIGSLIVWPFTVKYSCPTQEDPLSPGSGRTVCLPGTFGQNKAWRWSMLTMGAMVIFFCIIRSWLMPLAESPKWLASQGRDAEAIEVLESIAKANRTTCPITLADLQAIAQKYGVESHAKLTNKAILKRSLADVGMKHIRPLFSTRRIAINTTLIILIYAILGLAYPLFNSFLGLYLTQIPGTTTNEAYSGFALQAFCGLPGSFMAAALVEWKVTGRWAFISGRRGAMAFCTISAGAFLFAFTSVKTRAQVTAMNCMASFFQNGMYGILYGYAPEVFATPSRGTGDAFTATAARIAGLMAPVIKNWGPQGNSSPVLISAALFIVSGLLMLALPIETAGEAAL
ncbi:MFS general substrate transporter [Mrakia frigida]|uniref:MFS general substrate transporter n=1 Tax=Mrakia frigida TaxID=29902 RepID=UPI003FCBF5E5